jgi:hypothetical protein
MIEEKNIKENMKDGGFQNLKIIKGNWCQPQQKAIAGRVV